MNIKKIQIYSALSLASFSIPLHPADGTGQGNKAPKSNQVLLFFRKKNSQDPKKTNPIEYAYLVTTDTTIGKLATQVLQENKIEADKKESENVKTFRDAYTDFFFFAGKLNDEKMSTIYFFELTLKDINNPNTTVDKFVKKAEEKYSKAYSVIKDKDGWKDRITHLKKNKGYGYMRVPKGDNNIEKVSFYKEFYIIIRQKDGTLVPHLVGPKKTYEVKSLDKLLIKEGDDVKNVFFLTENTESKKYVYKEVGLNKEIFKYSFEELSEEVRHANPSVLDISQFEKKDLLERAEEEARQKLKESNKNNYRKTKMMIYVKEEGRKPPQYAYLVDYNVPVREIIEVILAEKSGRKVTMSDDELLSEFIKKYTFLQVLKKKYDENNVAYLPIESTKKRDILKQYLDKAFCKLVTKEVNEWNEKQEENKDKIGLKKKGNGWTIAGSITKRYWHRRIQYLQKNLIKNRLFLHDFLKMPPKDLDQKIIKLHRHYKEFNVIAKEGNKKSMQHVHFVIGSKKKIVGGATSFLQCQTVLKRPISWVRIVMVTIYIKRLYFKDN